MWAGGWTDLQTQADGILLGLCVVVYSCPLHLHTSLVDFSTSNRMA